MKYELVFAGSAGHHLPRHRRMHRTLSEATSEATRVLAALESTPMWGNFGAIIYGPGCGKDGVSLGNRPSDVAKNTQATDTRDTRAMAITDTPRQPEPSNNARTS